MFRSPKSFLICDRDFIIEKVLGKSESVYKFTEEDRRIAEIEAESKGFFSYSSDELLLWQINFEYGHLVFMNPITDGFKIGIYESDN